MKYIVSGDSEIYSLKGTSRLGNIYSDSKKGPIANWDMERPKGSLQIRNDGKRPSFPRTPEQTLTEN